MSSPFNIFYKTYINITKKKTFTAMRNNSKVKKASDSSMRNDYTLIEPSRVKITTDIYSDVSVKDIIYCIDDIEHIEYVVDYIERVQFMDVLMLSCSERIQDYIPTDDII